MNGLSEPYAGLMGALRGLLETERDFTANAANCAALLFQSLPELNWAGFYVLKGGQLVLGPFQGAPACVRIDLGRGVCGAAAVQRKTIVVPDVHQFPGHIACDERSRSEIVVPLIFAGRLVGVLDLDSPKLNRFDSQDAEGLEEVARIFLTSCDVPDAV
jgi:L-methionine (R)-S-oxide reductase